MIAFCQRIPLISFAEGVLAPFDTAWLLHSLEVASEKAGYRIWPLAEHLTKSICIYLERESHEGVFPLSALQSLLTNVLEELKYPNIAEALILRPPPVGISLFEIVQEAGEGYELSFFQLLKERIEVLRQAKVTRIDFYDLKTTLRYLKSRLRLHHYQALRDEITSFLRFYTLGASDLFQHQQNISSIESLPQSKQSFLSSPSSIGQLSQPIPLILHTQ